MKTLLKHTADQGIWLTRTQRPSCGHNDVLIKIRKTAICGTDVHIYNWDEWAQSTVPLNMSVGHEFVGTVTEVGVEVSNIKVGDRVSGEGHITCGHCRNCRAGKRHYCKDTQGVGVNRPGAFAEYLVIPACNVVKLPDNISDDLAAILDPLGNATHTALTYDLVGEDVLITGAGPIGAMAAAIAKHVGARNVVISDINDYRLQLAKSLGATRVVNTQRESLHQVIEELQLNEGFSVGLEMSGNDKALKSMIRHMSHGGKVALLGIPSQDIAVDWNQIIFKGLTIKGIYGREMYETWYKMIAMLQSGLNISPIITHHFDIHDFQKGFDAMLSGESGKVILDWQAID
ncbi:L-threonine 3-dehydrogenase [Marinomonas aquimarina]|uniref:L-threonine 3-dehydrogenase n=1 Tax=Marinomonas aquimarina TaxID=295068 RepID=A0A1A8TMA4_9GAMM|nr:L-threonine 3-dehydrogenase [Marinomonas aquimarina]SBS33996.1 L-threonine 3-dehydrogenase [Marinomonas aquimarina]